MKKILFLVNSALGYLEFFTKISGYIEDKIEVVYAFESHFAEIRSGIEIENKKKYYYSEYTGEYDYKDLNDILDKLNYTYNLRKGYFPDFDRHRWFNTKIESEKSMDNEIIKLIGFFLKVIKENDIDFVVYENVSNIFSYCAYIATKILNKKYIGFIVSKMKGRFDVWFDLYGNLDKIEEDFKLCNIDDINKSKELNDYFSKCIDEKPEYLKSDIKEYHISYLKYYLKKVKLLKPYIYYNVCYRKERRKSIEVNNTITMMSNFIKRNLYRKIKINYLNFFSNKYFYNPDYSESYVLYPLHFQPESSTSVNAMYYINQYEVIKNIAFSLPLGMYLYVKDHPHAFGYFPLEFYKKIQKIPNVKLIHCDADTNKLIEGMKLLVTLTGTMGYEALIHKKPVISLGKVFYNVHPYCFNVNNYEDIFDVVVRILKDELENFEEYNKKLIYAYFKNTYNGRLVMNNYKMSDMDKIGEGLMNIIEKS